MDQRVALDGLEPPLVTLHSRGAASSPLILASPHAGRDYRAEFLAISRLDMAQLRRTEDAFVDQLFQDGPSHGVPLLCANFPRSWLDVNRDEWELDPAMFADQLPAQAAAVSARAAAGLGAIPRVASQGAPIYRRKLQFAEAEQRLAQAWRPYHRALAGLIEETKNRFGRCVLIDCHSMPSAHGGAGSTGAASEQQPADIVLGDAFGTSCRSDLVGWVESKLQKQGYVVKRNVPYAGGYVTRHYGKPSLGVDVLQLEIARSLYMDETAIEPHRSFEKTRRNCEELIAALARAVSKAG